MELSKAVNETRSRMDLAQSELDIYLSRHKTAVTQLNTAKQTLQTTSETLQERRAAIKDLQVTVPEKEQELKKVKPDVNLIKCNFTSASDRSSPIIFRGFICNCYINFFLFFCRTRRSCNSFWRWTLRREKWWENWGRRWMKPRAPCPPIGVEEKSWML